MSVETERERDLHFSIREPVVAVAAPCVVARYSVAYAPGTVELNFARTRNGYYVRKFIFPALFVLLNKERLPTPAVFRELLERNFKRVFFAVVIVNSYFRRVIAALIKCTLRSPYTKLIRRAGVVEVLRLHEVQRVLLAAGARCCTDCYLEVRTRRIAVR